jgi:hypothetical protein
MKVIPENGLILEQVAPKNTQKRQEDQPTVGHVHSTGGVATVSVSGHYVTVALLAYASQSISAILSPNRGGLSPF